MEVRVLSTAPFFNGNPQSLRPQFRPSIGQGQKDSAHTGSAFVLIARLGYPLLKHGLFILLDFCEHQAHAGSANVRDLALRRKDSASVENAEPNLGAHGPRFLRGDLAAEDANVGGLFADLGLGFDVDQIDAGGEGVTAGSRSLDQWFSP